MKKKAQQSALRSSLYLLLCAFNFLEACPIAYLPNQERIPLLCLAASLST